MSSPGGGGRPPGRGATTVVYFLPALVVAVLVGAFYVLTHPTPGHYGGLFFDAASYVYQHGYRLPARIPGYTAEGVPFAYPPLGIYMFAVLLDASVADSITLYRFVPATLWVLATPFVFVLARRLTGANWTAAVASVLVAASPYVFSPVVDATGITRGPAFVATLVALYAAVAVFRDGDRRYVAVAAVGFGLVVLSHPVYALFCAVSVAYFWAYFDRTLRGFITGAGVAAGGFLLASPYLAWAAGTHGIDIFLGTAGVRSGILTPPSMFVYWNLTDPFIPYVDVIAAFSLVSVTILLLQGRFFYPLWLALAGTTAALPQFVYFVGLFATATVLVEVVPVLFAPEHRRDSTLARAVSRLGSTASHRTVLTATFVGCILLYASVTGVHYTTTAAAESYLTPDDLEAMEWVEANTDRSAEFVVVGGVAEWFPAYANRTSLVTPMGSEWKGNPEFERLQTQKQTIDGCTTAACLTRTLQSAGVAPEYVYVSPRQVALSQSVMTSESYRTVYDRGPVLIAAYEPDNDSGTNGTTTGQRRAPPGASSMDARSVETAHE